MVTKELLQDLQEAATGPEPDWAAMEVFADALMENREEDLGYAFLWAARHKRYPSTRGEYPKCCWVKSSRKDRDWRKQDRYYLPEDLYKQIKEKEGWTFGTLYSPSVPTALRHLAKALRKLRDIVEIPR